MERVVSSTSCLIQVPKVRSEWITSPIGLSVRLSICLQLFFKMAVLVGIS